MPGFTNAEIARLQQLLQTGGDNTMPGSWLRDDSVAPSKLQSGIPGSKITSLAASQITGILPGSQLAETDPVFLASVAAAITSSMVSNWNLAFGWGNHAAAGYLTAAPYQRTEVLDAVGGETEITLSPAPYAGSVVQVFKNRALLREGVSEDFTISGATITLASAAAPSDEYLVFYTA